jgi:DNA repair exonuclease SbcCD ATPase subunit
MTDLERRIETLDGDISKKVIEKSLLTKQLSEEQLKLKEFTDSSENTTIARDLLEKSVHSAMNQGKEILEESTTEILRMVFGDNYSVKIKLDVKSGAPVADIYINKSIDGVDTDINIENEGGGLSEILSLALFISVTKIVSGNKAPITLDEPTSAVSELRAENTAEAIKSLLDYADRQAIIITHERNYLPSLIDTVYLVEQNDKGISKAKVI